MSFSRTVAPGFNISTILQVTGKKLCHVLLWGACLGLFSGGLKAGTWDDEAADNLWNSVANWSDNLSAAGQAVIFGDVGTSATAGTVTSILDPLGTFTISSLRFQQNGAALFHTLQIDTGRTLVINGVNSLKVGVGSYNASNIGTVDNANTSVTITGGGSLVVDNATGNLEVGMPTLNESGTNRSSLNLAGLSSFTTVVNELRVAWGRMNSATLTLSETSNDITANAIQISNSAGQNPGPGVMILGAGVNILRATNINLGLGKGDGTIKFASSTAGSPGTVVIEGKTAGSVANLTLGSATDTTGFSLVGTLDLRGHLATVTAGDVILGRRSGSGGGGATGALYFDQGTFTVNNLVLGFRTQDVVGTGGKATGVLKIGGGLFTVNAGGSFVLGTREGTTGTTVAEGIVEISGGTLVSNVDITHGGGVGATSTIKLIGGTLDMKGHQLGDATNKITTFDFQTGTLMNIGEINGGQQALVKSGYGTLVLEGVNTYTGGTTINGADILQVGSGGVTGNLGEGLVTVVDAALHFNRSNLMVVHQQLTGNNATLQQIGAGRTVLTGDNTGLTAGFVTVSQGILEVANVKALGSLVEGVDTLTVEGGGAFHFISKSGSLETLNVLQMDLASGSTIGVALGNTLNAVSGATVGTNVNLKLFGNDSLADPAGVFQLLQAGGGLEGAIYSLLLYNNTNFTASMSDLDISDTAVSVTTSAVSALDQAYWVGGRVAGHGGEWVVSNGTSSNWSSDDAGTITAVVPGANTDVFISATGGNAASMSLGADMNIGSLTFRDPNAVNLLDMLYILNLAKNNAITLNAGAGAANLDVRVNLAGTAPVLTVDSTSNALTLSGVVDGAAGFTKKGAGTLILSGVEANEYTGTITVEAGTLELAKTTGLNAVTGSLVIGDIAGVAKVLLRASDQIADGGVVTINAGGVLTLNGFNETIGSLNGTGAVENLATGTTSLLTVGAGDASGTFNGILRNGGAGPVLAITKIGTGTLTLGGAAANTYSGVTTVLGGVLALNKTAGINAVSGDLVLGNGTTAATVRFLASNQIANTSKVTVNAGAVLDLNGFVDSVTSVLLNGGDILGPGTLTSSAQFVARAGNVSANLAGTGGLRKETAGTVALTGNNTFTGTVKVDQGVLKALSNQALGAATNLVELSGDSSQARNPTLWLEGGVTLNIGNLRTSGAGNSGATPGVLYNASGVNTINVAANITLTAGNGGSTFFSQAGTMVLNAVSLTTADTGRVLTLDGPGNGVINAMIQNGATVTGLAIIKNGAGTWAVTGANINTGATQVNAGRYLVNGSHTGGGTYTVASGATLGGSGSITQAAGMNVVVNGKLAVGDSTLATPQAGTLTVTTSGSGALVFNSGSSLDFDLFGAGSGGNNSGDRLVLGGQLTIGSNVTLNVVNPTGMTNWAFGDTWTLFDWTEVSRTSATEFVLGSSFSDILLGTGKSWDLSKLYVDGTISIVPEPGRAVLLLMGAASLLLRRRRSVGGR